MNSLGRGVKKKTERDSTGTLVRKYMLRRLYPSDK